MPGRSTGPLTTWIASQRHLPVFCFTFPLPASIRQPWLTFTLLDPPKTHAEWSEGLRGALMGTWQCGGVLVQVPRMVLLWLAIMGMVPGCMMTDGRLGWAASQ